MSSEFKRNYQYNNLKLQVFTSDLKHHEWLKEFLYPSFQIVPDSNYNQQIFLLEDNQKYKKLLNNIKEKKTFLLDCFILDNRIVKLPSWDLNSAELIVFDENFCVFYLINKKDSNVKLVSPPNNSKIRIALMRVIREFAMSKAIDDGGVFIHGSAFSINGQGIIMAGRKRAGKTTLLLHNLHDSRTQYVSNDRVLISFTNTKLKMRGMPSIVTIEPSSLANFPELEKNFFRSGFQSNLTENEAQINPVKPMVRKHGKYSLTPGQLCSLLKTTPVSEVETKAIVLPCITQSTGTIKLSKLSLEESVKKINIALLSQACEKYQSDAFIPSPNTTKITQDTLKNRCQDLVSLITCYQCELGMSAYKASSEKLVALIEGQLSRSRID